jgi:hypothetical protein
MKFTKKEYEVLHSALNKIYNDENYSVSKLAQFFVTLKNEHVSSQTKKIQDNNELVNMIKAKDYASLVEVDVNIKNQPIDKIHHYSRRTVTCGFITWFNDLDKKEFAMMQKEFESHNINLALELQKDVLTYFQENKPYHNHTEDLGRNYVDMSKHYIDSLLNGEQNFDNEIKKSIFNTLAVSSISISNKESHKTTLKLIRSAIEGDCSQDKVLSLFKEFINNNQTINVQAKKDLEFIKEAIKDWDTSKYFSLAEKKMLYSKSDGITAKRVSGLYYDLDVNFIKTKNKSTSTLVSHNLRTLARVIPTVLGNIPDYVGTTQIFQEPLVQMNILFEKDVKEHQIVVMNSIMEEVLASKVQLKDDELLNKIKTTLLAVFLEDNLSDKSDQPSQRKKI